MTGSRDNEGEPRRVARLLQRCAIRDVLQSGGEVEEEANKESAASQGCCKNSLASGRNGENYV